MNNMASYIKRHNNKLLKRTSQPSTKSCNCRDQSKCPLDGTCLVTSIVYEAKIESGGKTMSYFGLTEGQFKTRYRNHIKTFNNPVYKSETELSKLVWLLKEQGKQFDIKWQIASKARPYQCGSRKCDLCTTEKLHIAMANPATCINKRDEIISKCRHRRKYKLSSIKTS